MFISEIIPRAPSCLGSVASSRGLRILLLALLLGAVASTRAAGPMTVAVSIPPQAWIAETIGGEHVEVEVMLPPGQPRPPTSPAPGRCNA